QEKWRVLRQVLQHAVGRLIGIDSESSPEHGVREAGQIPGETEAWRQPQTLRRQQTVVPSHTARRNNRDRAQRRQCRSRWRETCRITGDDEYRAARRVQIDVRSLIVSRI